MDRLQFGRLCKLEFTNFTTKKKFTLDQSLRISFEFLKSFDESSTSSTGKIVIYGLTQETAEKLGNRIGNDFQTEVRCSVGYAGDPENFQTLFYATVMSNKYRKEKGTSTTEIAVSANFAYFYMGEIYTVEKTNVTMGVLLSSFADAMGLTLTMRFDNIPNVDQNALASAVAGMGVMNFSFTGTMIEFLDKINRNYGFAYRVVKNDTQQTLDMHIDPVHSAHYAELAEVYAKTGKVFKAESSPYDEERKSKKDNISSLYLSDKSSNVAIVLGYATGLRELPYLDNRNVKLPRNQVLSSNEEVVERKAIKPIIDKKTGEQKKDKDGNLKFTKPSKLITVNRRFLTAKASLNPSIKPDSIIIINTGVQSIDGQYRARNCNFTGDTHEGDWIVEMELEDTLGFKEADTYQEQEDDNQEVETITNDGVEDES